MQFISCPEKLFKKKKNSLNRQTCSGYERDGERKEREERVALLVLVPALRDTNEIHAVPHDTVFDRRRNARKHN